MGVITLSTSKGYEWKLMYAAFTACLRVSAANVPLRFVISRALL